MSEPTRRGAVAADRLTRAADDLLAEVSGMPPALVHWVPAPDVWTVMDNLCHVREFVPFWIGEMQRIVSGHGEGWGRDHTNAARLQAVTGTSGYDLDHVVADIRAAAGKAAAVLRGLTDADLDIVATSRNPRWGAKPASFVVDDLIVGHVAKHQGQIRRNVAQFAAAHGRTDA